MASLSRSSAARFALVLVAVPSARGHGVLTKPRPRPASGMGSCGGDGAKITPFADAKAIVDGGCGGAQNGDPGVQVPSQVYAPGDPITIDWKLTLPHAADNLRSGVRVAIHYRPGDSFAQNVLVGGVYGSGVPRTLSAELTTITLTLPAP